MIKLNYIFLILTVSFITVSSFSNASSYKLTLDDKAIQFIPVIELNKSEYSSLENISIRLFRGMNYKLIGNNIKFNKYNLKFIPNTFFAMLIKDDSVLITQMQLPSILYQNKLYLPISSFLNSLDSLGLFSVDEFNNTFKLSSKISLPKKSEPEIAFKSIPKLRMDVKKITDRKINPMNEISDSYSKLYSSLKSSFDKTRKNRKSQTKKNLEIINDEEQNPKEKTVKKSEEYKDLYHLPKGLVRTEIENLLKETDPKNE